MSGSFCASRFPRWQPEPRLCNSAIVAQCPVYGQLCINRRKNTIKLRPLKFENCRKRAWKKVRGIFAAKLVCWFLFEKGFIPRYWTQRGLFGGVRRTLSGNELDDCLLCRVGPNLFVFTLRDSIFYLRFLRGLFCIIYIEAYFH